jgi:uncharacterized membrane protein SpoIIM required for sporulation
MLILQIILLTTVQALVMVTGAVVVSSQTTSTRAANLLASFIIIPMALVIQGESVIMFLAPDADSPYGIGALWSILVGMFFVVILLLRIGNSIFNREELLGRTIDQLNLRGMIGKIWRNFRAVDAAGTPAPNLITWYRYSIPMSVRRVLPAMGVTALVFAVFFIGGVILGTQPQWQLPFSFQSDNVAVQSLSQYIRPDLQRSALMFIVVQNARILLAALILGMFSFGVMALVLTPAVYVVLGYILMQVILSGNNPMIVAAAILPHGIVEIPVIVLATATALKLGSVVTRPPHGMTVGQGWQVAFADALKLWIGLVLPGLVLAALLESFLTPRVVLAVLGG